MGLKLSDNYEIIDFFNRPLTYVIDEKRDNKRLIFLPDGLDYEEALVAAKREEDMLLHKLFPERRCAST